MKQETFQTAQPQDLNINGLFLSFYLNAMAEAQESLKLPDQSGLAVFNREVYYLRSLISDDKRVEEIDASMIKEKEYLDKHFKDLDESEKAYRVGFRVINGCVKYLDHTLNINKRRVKVLADQADPNMPAPSETPDDDCD